MRSKRVLPTGLACPWWTMHEASAGDSVFPAGGLEETDRNVGLEMGARRLSGQTFRCARIAGTHSRRVAPRQLPRLARRSCRIILGLGFIGSPPDLGLSMQVARAIADGIGTAYPLTANALPGTRERLQVHLRLTDGTPLAIDVRPPPSIPLSHWSGTVRLPGN